MKVFIMQSSATSHPPTTSSSLSGPHILLSALFSFTLSVFFEIRGLSYRNLWFRYFLRQRQRIDTMWQCLIRQR